MRIVPFALLLVLGACDRAAEPPRPAATPSAAPPATAAPALPGPGALHGTVSGLHGVVTGFSTRTTALGTIVALDADILFDFDKASLRSDATAQLGATADAVRQGGAGTVTVVGYTDAKGGDAYNLDLSRRRAASVAAWLRGQAALGTRDFAVTGKGKADPVAPNTRPDGSDDPAGRARNRRVELVIPRAAAVVPGRQ